MQTSKLLVENMEHLLVVLKVCTFESEAKPELWNLAEIVKFSPGLVPFSQLGWFFLGWVDGAERLSVRVRTFKSQLAAAHICCCRPVYAAQSGETSIEKKNSGFGRHASPCIGSMDISSNFEVILQISVSCNISRVKTCFRGGWLEARLRGKALRNLLSGTWGGFGV